MEEGWDRRLISTLYYKQTASVQFGDEQSESFNIKRGVRQGCVLSPKLFNLYTEEIFRKSEDIKRIVVGGRNINNYIRIYNLRFADDTLLISEGEEELQQLTDKVREDSKINGLEMNVKKTKTMIITVCSKTDGYDFPHISTHFH